MKTALITGATAGIGKSTAQIFAENGYNVIITGRRQERLKTFKQELIEKYNIKVLDLCFDVRDKAQVKAHLGNLPEDWQAIDVLVNNAGLASGLDPIQTGDLEDWDKMVDTNIKGLLYVSRTIIPLMTARHQGHIVNIGSIAGKEVYANGNVYCATKHAVDALSKAMRIDLLPHGIKVTNIAPGLVDTEFSTVRFHGDQAKADAVYQNIEPLHDKDIAEVIWFAANRPANVNLNDVLIMPTIQANATTIVRKNN